LDTAVLAVFYGALFVSLGSQQYTAVEGALRCLDAFYSSHPPLHGNNHMLYPFWVWAWTQGLAFVGLEATDPIAFIRVSQVMNAVAASITIGMLCAILQAIAGTRYALLGTSAFVLSTAVMLPGTNSAEPVMGLMFSLVAAGLLIWGLCREGRVRPAMAGCCSPSLSLPMNRWLSLHRLWRLLALGGPNLPKGRYGVRSCSVSPA
jgi:hypothetical protein